MTEDSHPLNNACCVLFSVKAKGIVGGLGGGLPHARKSHRAPRTGSKGAGGALVIIVSLCVIALNIRREKTRIANTEPESPGKALFIEMTQIKIEFTTTFYQEISFLPLMWHITCQWNSVLLMKHKGCIPKKYLTKCINEMPVFIYYLCHVYFRKQMMFHWRTDLHATLLKK